MSDRTRQLQNIGIIAILILLVTNLVLSTWTFLQLQTVAERQAARSGASAATTGGGLAQRIKQQAETSLSIPDANSGDSTKSARLDGAGDAAASTPSRSESGSSPADNELLIPGYISPDVKRKLRNPAGVTGKEWEAAFGQYMEEMVAHEAEREARDWGSMSKQQKDSVARRFVRQHGTIHTSGVETRVQESKVKDIEAEETKQSANGGADDE